MRGAGGRGKGGECLRAGEGEKDAGGGGCGEMTLPVNGREVVFGSLGRSYKCLCPHLWGDEMIDNRS